MSDPVINAITRARATATGGGINLSESSADVARELRDTTTTNLNERLNRLPLDKDPLLIARQKEAEALEIKAKVSEARLVSKDRAVESAKDGIKVAVAVGGSNMPKLPVLDKKILDGIALAKQLKNLYKERSKVSKENLKKGKELYSYPIGKITPISLETLESEVPIPKVPSVPKLPFKTNR
jgi:hypothetical protein